MSCPIPPSPDRDVLAEALKCATSKQATVPCEVVGCFNNYRSRTPAADIEPSVQRALDSAGTACRLQSEETEKAHKRERDELSRQAENDAWIQAQKCAASADPCVVKSCYASYLAQFGALGTHREEVEGTIAGSERGCRLPVTPDGRYLARTRATCGERPESVTVEINHDRITWRHDYHGTNYPWEGTIDASGTIQAFVRGSTDLRGSGRFSADGAIAEFW
jgi:hypothetical protein